MLDLARQAESLRLVQRELYDRRRDLGMAAHIVESIGDVPTVQFVNCPGLEDVQIVAASDEGAYDVWRAGNPPESVEFSLDLDALIQFVISNRL